MDSGRLISFFLVMVAFVLGLGGGAIEAAPIVSNVTFSQEYDSPSQGTIGVITYDLSTPGGSTTVTLLATGDSANEPPVLAEGVEGDVGPNLTTGTGYRIRWLGLRHQYPNLTSTDFQISILANDGGLVPLEILPSIAMPATAKSPSQSFTINFSEPVLGFDASSIAVAGGTTTTFVQTAPHQYVLGVEAAGGLLSITVPSFAARALADSEGNSSATASLFYQDLKTINLPGGSTMDLIRIPAGTFVAGASTSDALRLADESPTTITLTSDWYMGITEVTQAQWLAVMGAWPASAPAPSEQGGAGVGADFPAYHVSFNDAHAFLGALNNHLSVTGQGIQVRLPSEAEWERSAKAGGNTQFSFGDVSVKALDLTCDLVSGADQVMWYCANQNGLPIGTKPVAQKQPNPYGLYDMHGNVYEWCEDWYAPYATSGNQINPTGPASGAYRVIRGGCWYGSLAFNRSAHRNSLLPALMSDALGFRVAANP